MNYALTNRTTAYGVAIERMRLQKDAFFFGNPRSPIPPHRREGGTSLSYFAADPRFRVSARLLRHAEPAAITLATSKGTPREMIDYGVLEFDIDGAGCRLHAYRSLAKPGHEPGPPRLFVPFRDATSAVETYGAGRYLDIDEQEGPAQLLDFNQAYNPFCAYSEAYVCPLPPRVNWLAAAIRAGEQRFGG